MARSSAITGGDPRLFSGEAHVAFGAGSDRIRAGIVAAARLLASDQHAGGSQPVPANRIAVTPV